jgi:hypothetical protein
MERKISLSQRLINCLTINFDSNLFRVKFRTKFADDYSIDAYSTFDDELVGSPAARNAGIGDDLVQTGNCHINIPFPRLSIKRQSTTPPLL